MANKSSSCAVSHVCDTPTPEEYKINKLATPLRADTIINHMHAKWIPVYTPTLPPQFQTVNEHGRRHRIRFKEPNLCGDMKRCTNDTSQQTGGTPY